MGRLQHLCRWHLHLPWHVLWPLRHLEEEDDDDFRRWRQVQGLYGLLHPSHQERGLHVPDEGSRSKHSAWRRRRWRACRLRQVPGHVHRMENCQRLVRPPGVLVYHPPIIFVRLVPWRSRTSIISTSTDIMSRYEDFAA